jgi:protein-S-isoprenylcysteine O-methyltransferase Ste14
MYDFPFHMLFLIYSLAMVSYRSYFHGYVDAEGEAVPKFAEGVTLKRIRYSLGLPFLLGCLIYLINPAWMTWSGLSDFPRPLRWAGMGILLVSAVLYKWTHLNLGKNFTDTVYVRGKSKLITTGPYRWVRHPMYVSGVFSALGTGVGLANWFLGLVGILLMCIIMYWRTPIEEQMLIGRHGEAYIDYMKTTGKYFPKF